MCSFKTYLNWSFVEDDCCTIYKSDSSDEPLGGFHDSNNLLALDPVDFTSRPSILLGAGQRKIETS